ncbi:MAG: TonB-dependent receptor [Gemmatimonadota bacterium]
MIPSLLALAVLVGPLPVQRDATATVEGVVYTVRDGVRAPLPYASVELMTAGASARAGAADADGRYRFDGVNGGAWALQVQHVGYRSARLELVVPATGVLRVDVELTAEPVRMPGVTVRGERTPVPRSEDGSESAMDPGVADRIVAQGSGIAGSGLLDLLRALPGEEPPDGSEVLFMRGSSLDLKSVRLDGAPVFTPFHVGGLIPSFDEWLMGRSDLWVGGAPAEHDGGLNYVLDLRTRKPAEDGAHGVAALDLLGARAAWTAPVGSRAGVLVGGRALHQGLERLFGGERSPYGYVDGLVRTDLAFGEHASLRATWFRNLEQVALDYTGTVAAAPAIALPARAEWGNAAGSVELTLPLADGDLSLSAAQGRYDAALPLAGGIAAYASGHTTRRDLSASLHLPRAAGGGLRLGLSGEWLLADYSARALASDGSVRLFESRTDAAIGAAFADLRTPIGTEASLRLGARATYRADDGVRLAPRVGLAWLLSEDAALSISVGRYHQLVSTAEQEVPQGLAAAVDAPSADEPSLGSATLFTVASANHLMVSLDQMVSGHTRLALDGYYKRFFGLMADPGRTLSSSGADLRVRRRGERFEGWAGYSLSWSWSEAGQASDRFVGRQLLSLGLRGELNGWSGVELRLAYGDGLPLTAVATAGENLDATPGRELGLTVPDETSTAVGAALQEPPLTGGASGDFLRVDAELHGEFERRLWGRDHRIRPYAKVLNALARRDALFYYFERWRGDEVRPLADLSVVPVIGIEWRF